MNFEPLCIGIKRAEFRVNDAGAKQADVVFESRRDASLQKAGYRCVRCGYESSEDLIRKKRTTLHVHHLDDDHHNNEPDNHAPHCSLDHAYHHIGCNAPTSGGAAGWARQMVIGYAPEVSAEDMNQLQRAIGAALNDPKEAEVAKEILSLLGALALPVRDVFESFQASDFAAGFAGMSPSEYEARPQYVSGLRVLFHPNILKQVGSDMILDAPLSPVKSWRA
jgi:intracellular multiplication protein IcmJ